MTENPLDGLIPITITLSEEDFDRLVELLDRVEPTDEQLNKVADILSKPSRIEIGPHELR